MTQQIAAALRRAEAVLRRRPAAGLHDDAPGLARWDGGTRIVASHPSGHQMLADMPSELGGTGDQVSPGWMVRAGLASCTATCIAMAAASAGIELDRLDVRATSRSDTRGLFGLAEPDGAPTYPGPRDLRLSVRIAAAGVTPARLRALVEDAQRTAPMMAAIQDAVPVTLGVEIDTA